MLGHLNQKKKKKPDGGAGGKGKGSLNSVESILL